MFIQFPGDHSPHHYMGDYFCEKFTKHKYGTKSDFERGLSHHLYHAYCTHGMYGVAENYNAFDKTRDLVKGAAAAQAVIRRGNKDYVKNAKAWLAQAQKAMNDEQKAEFKQLVEDGFPAAKKFREPAFKKLQEIGDLPKDWNFDNKEEDDGVEEEEASYQHEPTQQMLVMYKQGSGEAQFTTEERVVFEAYLKGNDISDEKLNMLVSLLIENDEKLNALLDSFKGEKKASLLKAIIGKEYKLKGKDSPIPAELGWYVTYKEKKLISAPLITKLYKQNKKGTVRTSDVLMDCYGVNLARPNSRNLFMRLVHLWPAKIPLKLKVRRTPHSQHPGWQGQKNTYTNAMIFVH